MKKKGFTLIEIIVCVALLSIVSVGTTIMIVKYNKDQNMKLLSSNSKLFENALNVYLSKHPEVIENLNDNVKGSIISLEVLKNEGLIKDNILSEDKYKSNYYFLSNSVLLSSDTNLSSANKECDNNVIGIQTISSWDLKNVDSSKIIYICPRDNNSESNTETTTGSSGETVNGDINSIVARDGYYIAKGNNPNNYVKFEVITGNSETDPAYFPNDENKNLWRIVSVNDTGNLKLVYNKSIESNNINYYDNNGVYEVNSQENCRYSSHSKRYNYDTVKYQLYKLQNYTIGDYYSHSFKTDSWYKFSDLKGMNSWTIFDLLSSMDSNNESNYKSLSKLNSLYNQIKEKNWIDDNSEYQYEYKFAGGIYQMNSSNYTKSKFGALTIDDINSSLLFGKSWLSSIDTISGYREENGYAKLVYLSGISAGSQVSTSEFSYNYSCQQGYKYPKNTVILNTRSYYPVVSLSNKVSLVAQDCGNDSTVGSQKCPYSLEYNDNGNCKTIVNDDENATETKECN